MISHGVIGLLLDPGRRSGGVLGSPIPEGFGKGVISPLSFGLGGNPVGGFGRFPARPAGGDGGKVGIDFLIQRIKISGGFVVSRDAAGDGVDERQVSIDEGTKFLS